MQSLHYSYRVVTIVSKKLPWIISVDLTRSQMCLSNVCKLKIMQDDSTLVANVRVEADCKQVLRANDTPYSYLVLDLDLVTWRAYVDHKNLTSPIPHFPNPKSGLCYKLLVIKVCFMLLNQRNVASSTSSTSSLNHTPSLFHSSLCSSRASTSALSSLIA